MPSKRKVYLLESILEAIARVLEGQSQSKISRKLEVPELTIRGWLKDENNISDYVHDVDNSEKLQRKRPRMAQYSKLDALFTWFVHLGKQCWYRTPISAMIRRTCENSGCKKYINNYTMMVNLQHLLPVQVSLTDGRDAMPFNN